jgi:1,2-phenylacetyl-CoA epoxidase catalytic subunit
MIRTTEDESRLAYIKQLADRANEIQTTIFEHLKFDESDALMIFNLSAAATIKSIDNLMGCLYEELSTLKQILREDFHPETGKSSYDESKDYEDASKTYGEWYLSRKKCPYIAKGDDEL